jgi:glucosamine-6-phosphate deaminase
MTAGHLEVRIYENRLQMGDAAAAAAANTIRTLLETKRELNIIFAAAPSQNEFLQALQQQENIDWSRINAFHMDEYIGLSSDAPQAFGNFLKARLFDALPFKSVHYINDNSNQAYAHLLLQHPTDIVCMGIGENGHIAFNDPPVADFADLQVIKVVELDEVCRQQQVNDGCFAQLGDVPTHALTLTIPTLMKASYVFCMVPGTAKAKAVYDTVHADMRTSYPSTILRTHPAAILFLDEQSAGLLELQKA